LIGIMVVHEDILARLGEWAHGLCNPATWPPSEEYIHTYLLPLAYTGLAVSVGLAIWSLVPGKKPKARGVPVKAAGPNPGEARRNKRYLTFLETPWEGADTLASLFEQSAKKNAGNKCLGHRRVIKREEYFDDKSKRNFEKLTLGEYQFQTYQQVFERVERVSSGLIALGHKPRENLGIFAETQAGWIVTLQAATRQSIPVVTVYASLGDDALVHALGETEVKTVVADLKLMGKLAKVADKLTTIERVIYFDDINPDMELPKMPKSWHIVQMKEVEALGEKQLAKPTLPKASDLAVIMYTSGSTGMPKGVMIPHSAIVAASAGVLASVSWADQRVVYLAYLPLAHVLELAAEHAILTLGACIGYGSALTLTDQSPKLQKGTKGDAPTLRPTIIAAVPAIMDRIRDSVNAKISQAGFPVSTLYKIAYKSRLAALESGFEGLGIMRRVWDLLVFRKVKDILGGRLQMIVSGGAPLSGDTQRFINIAMGCPIAQGYGLTETCAIGTIAELDDLSVGRVGPPVASCNVKLIDWSEGNYRTTDKPLPRGEICIGGPVVTRGYYKNEKKTKEDFSEDEDGVRWFHTGDVGQWHPDGVLEIVDRKKDIVKLQMGEYVSLGKVEAALSSSPYVDNLMVYADSNHSFCVALVVASKALKDWAGGKDLNGKEVEEEVKKSMQKVAKEAKLEKFEVPAKVKVLEEPWTPDNGLVTQAMKLKRDPIRKKFREDLDKMYSK